MHNNIDIYENLTFYEDEIINNPEAFYDNGNRKCQHVLIQNKENIKLFLDEFNLSPIIDDNLSFSILWNFPRKKYNETKMWVCISGFTYDNKDFIPKHFVISNNIVTDIEQKKLMMFCIF